MRLIKLHINNPRAALQSHLILRLMLLALTAAALVGIHYFYQPFTHPAILLACLGATAVWSWLQLTFPAATKSRWGFSRELTLDYVWVGIVVSLSGGSANPFIYYYLVLVAIGASALSTRLAWAFCLGGIGIYSLLLFMDIKVHFQHMPQNYQLHLLGMWLNFVGSSLVTCFFVSYLKKWGQAQQQQLSFERENNLKNEQLIGLGTVSATTIHALATPLATLTLLTENIRKQSGLDTQTRADLATMHSQIARCRKTIQTLSHMAQQKAEPEPTPVANIVQHIEEHYALQNPDTHLSVSVTDEAANAQVLGDPMLPHALINLINNALESDPEHTTVSLLTRADQLHIKIKNQSHLTADEIIDRWGRPSASDKALGLGIGSMLANSTIERLGGSVTLDTNPLSNSANQVSIDICMPVDTHEKNAEHSQ